MAVGEQSDCDVVQLNRAMEDRASVGRWADFAALMRQRDKLLASLPAELQRAALASTLEANARILAHARSDREQVRERLDNVRQKGAVSSYYEKHSGVPSE